jgi:hypothetical protein
MEDNLDLVPIKKVFTIIDSCTNTKQIEGCQRLAKAYTELVRAKGVINFDLVDKTLQTKIKQKIEQLELIESFSAR